MILIAISFSMATTASSSGASYADIHVGVAGPHEAHRALLRCRHRLVRKCAAALCQDCSGSAVLVFGTSLAVLPIGTALFQRIYVKPNELKLESTIYRAQYRVDA